MNISADLDHCVGRTLPVITSRLAHEYAYYLRGLRSFEIEFSKLSTTMDDKQDHIERDEARRTASVRRPTFVSKQYEKNGSGTSARQTLGQIHTSRCERRLLRRMFPTHQEQRADVFIF